MTDEDRTRDLTAAVVVVNWNGAAVLPSCLDSLRATLPGDVVVVVSDNASTDGSRELVRHGHPGVVLVENATNGGFSAGVNAGVAATDADVVLLLNNDAVATPGWFEAMTTPLRDDPRVGAVTGRVELDGWFAPTPPGEPGDLVGADGRAWSRVGPDAPGARRLLNSTGNEVTASGNGRDRDWLRPADAPVAPAQVFGFNGGCAALRRAALDDVGALDESYFLYYEDTELSWRLRRRGWRVVHAPDAVTVHRHGASAGPRSRVFVVQNTGNRLRTALRHGPWSMVLRAWLHALGRLVRPGRGTQLAGIALALRHLPGDLRVRRRTDRTARVPRAVVAALAVPDGAPA